MIENEAANVSGVFDSSFFSFRDKWTINSNEMITVTKTMMTTITPEIVSGDFYSLEPYIFSLRLFLFFLKRMIYKRNNETDEVIL